MKRLPLPRLSLLAKFGLMSLIPIVLSTLILGPGLGDIVSKRNLAVIEEQAMVLSELRLQPRLESADLVSGLRASEKAAVEDLLASKPGQEYLAGIRIWSRDGGLVYADRASGSGDPAAEPGLLASALAGDPAADPSWSEDGALEEGPNAYVPLGSGPDGKPAAAAQLFLPSSHIADLVRVDTKNLYLILLAGFTLFYAALFRIVANASKKMQRQASENEYLALHDSLTGLPNRALFLERANQSLLSAKRSGWNFAVMIMDLDRFKEINDTLGHHHGDMVLRQIGVRLEPLLRETDTVARLGGTSSRSCCRTLPTPPMSRSSRRR